jgi:hypothetical protein
VRWSLAIALSLGPRTHSVTCVRAAGPGRPAEADHEPVPERESLLEAMIRLPLAAGLGAALAMRPRRAGTPARKLVVVQTQVVLAVIGALVMVVVGASLARAFGVVGIAGLIRYRAKIEDPKDASVMLAALGVGLGAGVGLVWISSFATAFLLGLLWVLESKEPEATVPFALKGERARRGPAPPRARSVAATPRARLSAANAGHRRADVRGRCAAGETD